MRSFAVRSSEQLVGQALHDGAEQQGGEEGERADDHDDADQQHRERGRVGAEGAGADGRDPLSGQGPGDGEPASIGTKRPKSITRPPSRSAKVIPYGPALPGALGWTKPV